MLPTNQRGGFDERRRRRREGRRHVAATIPSAARDERAKPSSSLSGRARLNAGARIVRCYSQPILPHDYYAFEVRMGADGTLEEARKWIGATESVAPGRRVN